MKILILVCIMTATCHAQSAELLEAIKQAESGGRADAVGDNGKAIGCFQIHRVYWQDAVDFDPSIGGSYRDCYDPAYAEKVVRAYMRRYAPKGASDEQMARIHNGGPSGHKKTATIKYWEKVRKHL